MKMFDQYLPRDRTASIAEAAVLSARFPFFTQAEFWKGDTPAQLLCSTEPKPGCKNPLKVRFVDGGYNDNSGLQSLDDLVSDLEENAPDLLEKLQFHVIALTGLDSQSLSGNAFNELGTPVKAMFKMWGSQAMELRSEFRGQFSPAECRDSDSNSDYNQDHFGGFYEAELDTKKGSIPLGWKLSKESRQSIATQILQNSIVSSCS